MQGGFYQRQAVLQVHMRAAGPKRDSDSRGLVEVTQTEDCQGDGSFDSLTGLSPCPPQDTRYYRSGVPGFKPYLAAFRRIVEGSTSRCWATSRVAL